jgi:signal transduction histidine kinase
MRIQTQFHLLIAGILLVPLLFIIGQIEFVQSMRRQEQAETAAYADVAILLDESLDFDDREAVSRFISRISRIGDIAVFREDLLVVHSTISEFAAGAYESLPHIFEVFDRKDIRYSYAFENPGWMYNQGYILIRREIPVLSAGDGSQKRAPLPPDFRFGPPFFPVGILLGFFLMFILFAITMSLIIVRSITKSVMVLENATRRIAAGELDVAVDVHGSNEITSLTNNLNKMRNALKEEEYRRSRFITGVTHDLKTPLALIKAYAEAIDDGITEDPDTQTSATEIISAKADQLEGMINDLLEYVQMDSGEWRSQLQKVNISAFLRNAAKKFSPDVELLHHEFRSEIALSDNLYVFMDERLVLQILENLVNNAIRYTPDGSTIRLTASLVDRKNVNTLQLMISDNGPGIEPADLPHIFEMFYRGTSSRREQGMGMGLAVVKWVVDSHGWLIAASSEKGQGACFCITIPLYVGTSF